VQDGLTCGERVVRCLLGEPVDRVPFGVGLGWSPWSQTQERWRRESGKPDLEVWKEFGYDASFALPELDYGLRPGFASELLSEDEEFLVVRDARGITARHRRDGSSMPQFLDYPVKTPEDWARVKEERLRADTPGRVAQDWEAFRTRLRETGEAVQVGVFPWGVFGSPRDLLGVESLCVALCEEPEMVRDMMQHLTGLWISLWEQVAEEVPIDHIHIWEDMSGKQGSLISPAMVQRFMMPQYDRIVAFARNHGVRLVSVDTDGDCRELVPVMCGHGINYFLPFEVQAGNDIRQYRRQYSELGISGGLDKRALAAGIEDVEVEVAKAAEMVKKGRYIPGFDHLIPPDAKWENVVFAAEQIKRVCYDLD
jgi:uroporphyrinogen-III decarboxylase